MGNSLRHTGFDELNEAAVGSTECVLDKCGKCIDEHNGDCNKNGNDTTEWMKPNESPGRRTHDRKYLSLDHWLVSFA